MGILLASVSATGFLKAAVPSQRPAADINTIHGADGADALQGIGQQWAPFLLASVSPTGFLRLRSPRLGLVINRGIFHPAESQRNRPVR
jgi:hypothetical protein